MIINMTYEVCLVLPTILKQNLHLQNTFYQMKLLLSTICHSNQLT